VSNFGNLIIPPTSLKSADLGFRDVANSLLALLLKPVDGFEGIPETATTSFTMNFIKLNKHDRNLDGDTHPYKRAH
jgi:hypothetical protein